MSSLTCQASELDRFAGAYTVEIANFTPIQAAAGSVPIGASAVAMLPFLGRIAGVAGIIRRALIPAVARFLVGSAAA